MIEPLLRIDEKMAQLAWPALEAIPEPHIESGAVVIVACGFEDRAAAYLERAVNHGCKGFRVLAIDYRPYYDENRKSELETLCRLKDIDLTWIVYNRREPEGIGRQMLDHFDSGIPVFMDISGMSRLLIVQLLVALGRRPQGYEGVRLIYTEAKEYPPSHEEFVADCVRASGEGSDPELAFISWGVQALAVVPELTSPSMQGQATRLIAFPSFNRIQLRQTVDELLPTRFDLIDGIPPYSELRWRKDAIRSLNAGIIEALPNRNDHQASTLDYRETLRLLLEIYAAYSAYDKLVIAPTGSKMQSVAVGIAAAFIPDYQVVYPTPMKFSDPQRHTVGVRQFYQLDMAVFSLF